MTYLVILNYIENSANELLLSIHKQSKSTVSVRKMKRLTDHKADSLWLEVYLQWAEVIGSAVDGWKRLESVVVDHWITLVVILK